MTQRTLFDKLWDSHCIDTDADGESLLYIDRVCLHERTGSIALAALSDRGQPIRRPRHAFCVMDHILDTHPGRDDRTLVPRRRGVHRPYQTPRRRIRPAHL